MNARVVSCAALAACVVSIALFSGPSVVSTKAATDPAVACAVAKQKAAAKNISDEVKCNGTALKKGEAVDPACLTKADDKLDSSFGKAEDKGGCLLEGDAAAAKSSNDATVDQILNDVPSVPVTCPDAGETPACQGWNSIPACQACLAAVPVDDQPCTESWDSGCTIPAFNINCATLVNDNNCGEECCPTP